MCVVKKEPDHQAQEALDELLQLSHPDELDTGISLNDCTSQ